MKKEVIIIESPTKIDTISHFRVNSKILATKGHFKDLPEGEIGVNLETYAPTFVLSSPYAKNMISRLKVECRGARVYIASDPDREGYAIAKMVYDEILKDADEILRAEFFEITEKGVSDGIKNAVPFKDTNLHTYDAFLGRRIGDRMIGWIMSPKAKKAISTDKKMSVSVGRVQTPSVKLVIEKEKEILAFIALPKEKKVYYKVTVSFEVGGIECKAALPEDFINEEDALKVIISLSTCSNMEVIDVSIKKTQDEAPPPLMTSDLIEHGSKLLKTDGEFVMQTAQKLFEKGLITYMRVDSTRLADEFLSSAKEIIETSYSASMHQLTKHKSKVSQAEAHEAIRASNEIVERLEQTGLSIVDMIHTLVSEKDLSTEENKILRLIYARAFASQCAPSKSDSYGYVLRIGNFDFKMTNSVMRQKGYKELMETIVGAKVSSGVELSLSKGDVIPIKECSVETKMRKAPTRYDEGSLTKELEKLGIGRPSTYISYIKTIKKNGYILIDEKRKLAPTEKAFKLISFLEVEHPWILEYSFTAEMENFLDDIQHGKKKYQEFCKILHEKMGMSRPDKPSPPSQKQIDYMESLSKSIKENLPANTLQSFREASKWIEYAKEKKIKLPPEKTGKAPSPKQIEFAQKLSSLHEKELTNEVLQDQGLLAAFINSYATPLKKEDNKDGGGEKVPAQETNKNEGRLQENSRKPTQKQIDYVLRIGEAKGISINKEMFLSYNKTSEWIEKNK